MYHAAAALVCRQHQHLGNLDVCRSVGCIHHNVGDVIAGERLDTLVDIFGAGTVAVEAHV